MPKFSYLEPPVISPPVARLILLPKGVGVLAPIGAICKVFHLLDCVARNFHDIASGSLWSSRPAPDYPRELSFADIATFRWPIPAAVPADFDAEPDVERRTGPFVDQKDLRKNRRSAAGPVGRRRAALV